MPPANARAMSPRDVSTRRRAVRAVAVPVVVLVVVRCVGRARLVLVRARAGRVADQAPSRRPAGTARGRARPAGGSPSQGYSASGRNVRSSASTSKPEREHRRRVHHGDRRRRRRRPVDLRRRSPPCRRPSASCRDRPERVPGAERDGEHESRGAISPRPWFARATANAPPLDRRVGPRRPTRGALGPTRRPTRPGANERSHRRDVERARQQILRVGAERVAHACRAGTVEPRVAAPSTPTAVISRHPMLPASLPSAIVDAARSGSPPRTAPRTGGRQAALSGSERRRRSPPRARRSCRRPSSERSATDAARLRLGPA